MSVSAHSIPKLDRAGLRRFGFVTGSIVAVLFGLVFPWLLERALPIWPWVVFGVLAAWAVLAPTTLRGVYRGWMRLGLVLNKITTPLIMGVVFALVIVPAGLVMRMMKNDPLHRQFDRNADSYRIKSHKAPSENMEKPF